MARPSGAAEVQPTASTPACGTPPTRRRGRRHAPHLLAPGAWWGRRAGGARAPAQSHPPPRPAPWSRRQHAARCSSGGQRYVREGAAVPRLGEKRVPDRGVGAKKSLVGLEDKHEDKGTRSVKPLSTPFLWTGMARASAVEPLLERDELDEGSGTEDAEADAGQGAAAGPGLLPTPIKGVLAGETAGGEASAPEAAAFYGELGIVVDQLVETSASEWASGVCDFCDVPFKRCLYVRPLTFCVFLRSVTMTKVFGTAEPT